MKLEKALEILKERKKIRHNTWGSLIVEELMSNNIIIASDNRGYVYYFSVEEFKERFGKLKKDWKIVSEKEYADHTNPVKCAERIKNFVPSNLKKKKLSEILKENVVFN